MCKVHIFWDNSNIHIVGRNHVMKEFEPEEDQKLFRTVDEQIHLHKLTTKQKRRHEPDSLVRIDVPPTIHKEVHVS